MKKTTIIFFASLCLAIVSNAQKNSWYIGGNAGFGSSQNKVEVNGNSTDNGKYTTWSFSPEVGTFLTDHVQVGVGVTLKGGKLDNQSSPINTVSKETSYGGTLYGRYFFGKEAFKPFVGLNVTVLPGKSESTTGNVTSETKTFEFGSNLNAGFGYALSKRVTAVGSFGVLGFSQKTSEPVGGNTKSKTTSFGLDANSLGNRFNIGFYYTL